MVQHNQQIKQQSQHIIKFGNYIDSQYMFVLLLLCLLLLCSATQNEGALL